MCVSKTRQPKITCVILGLCTYLVFKDHDSAYFAECRIFIIAKWNYIVKKFIKIFQRLKICIARLIVRELRGFARCLPPYRRTRAQFIRICASCQDFFHTKRQFFLFALFTAQIYQYRCRCTVGICSSGSFTTAYFLTRFINLTRTSRNQKRLSQSRNSLKNDAAT